MLMSLACRSAIFLAEGPKFGPEPNFVVVLMVTLADVHASVLGAIFLAFSHNLSEFSGRLVLHMVMSLACHSAIF